MAVEEAKSRLRLEEVEAEDLVCDDCERARAASGDSTTYCEEHLRQIYGLGPRRK